MYVYMSVCMYTERERKEEKGEREGRREEELLKIRFFKICPKTIIMFSRDYWRESNTPIAGLSYDLLNVTSGVV